MNVNVCLTVDPLLFVLMLVISSMWLCLGFQILSLFGKWVNYYGRRREAPTVWSPGPPQSPAVQVGPLVQEVRRTTELTLPPLDPALVLKRVPKSAGFGGQSDGSRQSKPTSSQGSDDQKD